MRRLLLAAALLLLWACEDSPSAAVAPPSACATRQFEGSRFTVCDPGNGRIGLIAAAPGQRVLRRLGELQSRLGRRPGKVRFAMNAGMFDEAGRPIGLAIVDGKQVHAINLREGGGNFHLLPNGVFQVARDGTAAVVESSAWKPSKELRLATQSGPMLVIDGKLHPRFEEDGTSRNVRNGVGIAPDGRPRFVISEDPVSFGKLARFFRDEIRARNALYFDGSVSQLWDPAGYRLDNFTDVGPVIVVTR